jgi:succinate dehydrogenase flavin-adding protein (antitoxin of CptAB toxin-antitoxin module)
VEVVIILVVIVVIALIISVMNSNKPVADWDNDKLNYMLPKLEYAAAAQMRASNFEKYKEHRAKADEVILEIEKRLQEKLKATATKTADQTSPEDFHQFAQMMAMKSMDLLHRTMQEHECSEDEAKAIVANKAEELTKANIEAGMDEEEASEKAYNQLLGVNLQL